MERFTKKIVDMMKSEKLYASQGGPIILSQVKFFFFFLNNNYKRILKFDNLLPHFPVLLIYLFTNGVYNTCRLRMSTRM